jgi:hypothetical protein
LKRPRSWLLPLLLLAGLAALVTWRLPDRWEVTRSAVLAAPPEAVHAALADLRAWEAWSPLQAGHPDMLLRYGPAADGVVPRADWTSASLGDGWVQITAADPGRGVWYDMGFAGRQPFKGVLLHEPLPGGTRVTWTVAGDVGLRHLFRWTLPLMERVFDPLLEQGLERLAAHLEGAGPPQPGS